MRIPPVFTASATLGAEKNDTEFPKMPPLVDRQQILHHVTARLFVLWDKVLQRGWLVGGDTVTLLLLRVYAKKTEDAKLKNIDFSVLKNAGDSPSSAYKVLAELNDVADKEDKDKAEKEQAVKKEVTREQEKEKKEKTSVGAYLDELYAILMALSDKNAELNKTHAMSTGLQMWYHRKRATTFTGADFDELTGNSTPPKFYNYRIKRDPGWVRWVKEESLTFMLASGLGEVLEPKDGSCCSFFPTLPAGQNYLAAELRILKRFITKYAGGEDCFPPDQTVARLSRNHGWERRWDPFPRQRCHDGDDPSAIGPSCLPVQATLSAPLMGDTSEILIKDRGLLRDKPLYSVKDIKIMIDNNPGGVVVFGRQPKLRELGEISRRSRQRSQFAQRQTVIATAAQSLDRPSTRGSASGSTIARSLEPPGKGGARTEIQSSASGRRTPSMTSMTSMRSNGSGTHPGPSQGNIAGAGQPRPATSRSHSDSVQRAASDTSLRSTISNTRPKASLGDSSGVVLAQSAATQSPASSVHTTDTNASPRSIASYARSKASRNSGDGDGQPQAVVSRASGASVHRKASSTSMRSTASRTHPTDLQGSNIGSVNVAAHPQVLSSRSPAPSIREAASNASLRSISSTTRSVASNGGTGRPHEPVPASNVQTATRMASNASMRTMSSAASRATAGSEPQRSPAQDLSLKKTATNSSERTTGSQSSRIAQNLEAFNSNRQQQQLAAAARPTSSNQGSTSVGATKSPHPSSSGPAPMAAGGPESSS